MSKPLVKLGRMFEKTSANGNRYFTGRLGAARLLLFRNKEDAEDGSPIWNVFVQDVPEQRTEARPVQGELPVNRRQDGRQGREDSRWRQDRPPQSLDSGRFYDDDLSDVLP